MKYNMKYRAKAIIHTASSDGNRHFIGFDVTPSVLVGFIFAVVEMHLSGLGTSEK